MKVFSLFLGVLVSVVCFCLADRPLSNIDLYTRFRDAQKITCNNIIKDTGAAYNECLANEEKLFKYNLNQLRANCMSFYPMNQRYDIEFMCQHVYDTGTSSNMYYDCMIKNIQRLTNTNGVEELLKTEKAVAKCQEEATSYVN